MTEQFPSINTVDKLQNNIESDKKPPRYRTISSEILEARKDGDETIRVVECNNIRHRRCVDKISYDEHDQIIFADQLSREELGPCDCPKT